MRPEKYSGFKRMLREEANPEDLRPSFSVVIFLLFLSSNFVAILDVLCTTFLLFQSFSCSTFSSFLGFRFFGAHIVTILLQLLHFLF